MVENIHSDKGASSLYRASSVAVKEKIRAEYNRQNRTFGLINGGESKKIEHMVRVEESVAMMRVPTDYTSSHFLQSVKTEAKFKGGQIKFDTKGVGAYFSSDSTLYNQFISSITKARDHL